MSVIEFKNVNKYFGSGSAKVHALKDINFSADKGEFVLILGPLPLSHNPSQGAVEQ